MLHFKHVSILNTVNLLVIFSVYESLSIYIHTYICVYIEREKEESMYTYTNKHTHIHTHIFFPFFFFFFGLPCSMWDLSFGPGIGLDPCTGNMGYLNHWTATEVLESIY